jgi:hypothetical protein
MVKMEGDDGKNDGKMEMVVRMMVKIEANDGEMMAE